MNKRTTLFVLSLAEFLAMSVWFSASEVVPALSSDWHLSGADEAWLMISCKLDLFVGAFSSSLLNLSDCFAGHKLFGVTAILAAISTAAVASFAVIGVRGIGSVVVGFLAESSVDYHYYHIDAHQRIVHIACRPSVWS